MKHFLVFCLSLFFLGHLAQAQTDVNALESKLYFLPDITFKVIPTAVGYEASYELRILQPLDHKDPSKGSFTQRLFLNHAGYDRPTVIVTEGYQRPNNYVTEPAEILKANQIIVEHRFFGVSVPDSMDYQYLNYANVTADLHHIRTLFAALYAGHWLSTGISKGGTTTIFYRYFYPQDVTVSMPYVAPLNLALEEPRIYEWLNKKGDAECRARIKAFQEAILRKRAEVLPRLSWYAKGADLKFSYFSLEQAFELAVLEYPFSVWQWGTACSTIPAADAEVDVLVEELIDVVGISFFGDKEIAMFGSHYYQSATEMGYYGYDIAPFKGLVKTFDSNPSAAFVPGKMQVSFDPSLAKKVDAWLSKNGNRFVYIYGGDDTWTATGVPVSKKVDALWMILEGKDHRGARIKQMTEEEKSLMMGKLVEWME